MVIGRLTGIAITLSLLGATGAGAETIYVNDPAYIEAPPGYVVVAPAPVTGPRYVVTASGQAVMAAPQRYIVVLPQTTYVAPQPTYVTPRYGYRSELQTANPHDAYASGVLDTTYVEPGCTIDSFGFERCY